MRFTLFYHSLQSDWNHGNAHFLRGYAGELMARGHEIDILEPEGNWSVTNLLEEEGPGALEAFRRAYPRLSSRSYTPSRLDLDEVLRGTDVVIAHEWNDHSLVARLGRYRAAHPRMRLLFHDTHHRAISQPEDMAGYDLSCYDGALVFGEVLRRLYTQRGWVRRAFTWHEAADTRVFRPHPEITPGADLLWIGNWGDDERTQELEEFLIDPVRRLGISATVHGVRYPREAKESLARAGITFGGWLSNAAAPAAFARHRIAVHIPRRHYASALPGIPTIRVFETLACGTPLVSAPWSDEERLFEPGDFLPARDGLEMTRRIAHLLGSEIARTTQSRRGLATIRRRHTCAHRVDELLAICRLLGAGSGAASEPAA